MIKIFKHKDINEFFYHSFFSIVSGLIQLELSIIIDYPVSNFGIPFISFLKNYYLKLVLIDSFRSTLYY